MVSLPYLTLNQAQKEIFYVLKDSNMEIDGQSISGGSMVTLDSSKNTEIKNLGSKTKILMLQGVPINEPVVKYGPFVMNTRSEISRHFMIIIKLNLEGGNGVTQTLFMV